MHRGNCQFTFWSPFSHHFFPEPCFLPRFCVFDSRFETGLVITFFLQNLACIQAIWHLDFSKNKNTKQIL
uniref:Ovule protein n=1 Tax=Panagrolaimus sp. JU765 TaxID=591449 RepID=A0AC34PXJ7_9BILA